MFKRRKLKSVVKVSFLIVAIIYCVQFLRFSFHGSGEAKNGSVADTRPNYAFKQGNKIIEEIVKPDVASRGLLNPATQPKPTKTSDSGRNHVVSKFHSNRSRILPGKPTLLSNLTKLKPYSDPIPVLVLGCNRPTITDALDSLLKYRGNARDYPIIVSLDCQHKETTETVHQYLRNSKIQELITQPNQSNSFNIPKKKIKLIGYWKVARHYKFALDYMFLTKGYKAAIILEDDLLVSPDFFHYFRALLPLLQADPTLLCISAWNDNGQKGLISSDSELLYRTEFFPGLGWMMQRSLWDELSSSWPETFWDDWLRQDTIRKGRHSIRPEISRTHNFGKNGVSGSGMYKWLLSMELNSVPVDWLNRDLSYLLPDVYDARFVSEVQACPITSFSVAKQLTKVRPDARCVQVEYLKDKVVMKKMFKDLNLMTSFREGMPRTAYKGIMTVMHEGLRIYLVPPRGWRGYDPKVAP